MPRPRSIITAITHSATAATKPGLACVTRTPCALAAATSTVRMSTAQRMNANSSGSAPKSASGAAVWRYAISASQPRAAATRSDSEASPDASLKRIFAIAASASVALAPKYVSSLSGGWLTKTVTIAAALLDVLHLLAKLLDRDLHVDRD